MVDILVLFIKIVLWNLLDIIRKKYVRIFFFKLRKGENNVKFYCINKHSPTPAKSESNAACTVPCWFIAASACDFVKPISCLENWEITMGREYEQNYPKSNSRHQAIIFILGEIH